MPSSEVPNPERMLQALRTRIHEYVSSHGDSFFEDVVESETTYALLLKEISELDLALSKGHPYPSSWQRTKVLVNPDSSTCGYCSGVADPDDEWHVRGGPRDTYEPGDRNGCRARFTGVIKRGFEE